MNKQFTFCMPVEKIEIKDSGALKNIACLKIPELMVIAGPNGVGKSTLLESISKFLSSQRMKGIGISVSGSPKPVYIPPHRTPIPSNFHKSIPYTSKNISFRDTMALTSYSFSDQSNQLPTYLRNGTERSRLSPDFGSYFEVKNKIIRYETEYSEAIATVYKKKHEVPKDYVPDIYQPLRDLIEYLLPGIKFHSVKLEGEYYQVLFLNKSGELVEYDYLSSGEKDILSMLFTIVEKQVENLLAKVKEEKPKQDDLVILIDSPEANLHPNLQRIFLNYVRKSIREAKDRGEKLQFILATHSPIIINETTSDELFLMNYHEGDANQLINTKDLGIHQLQDYLGKLGLAAFTYGKPILLLEGEDDEEILRLLYPEIETKFVLYHLKGKEKVRGFVDAFDNLVIELQSRGIKIKGILDKDREVLITNKKSETQQTLHILPVYCIENVLLEPKFVFDSMIMLAGKERMDELSIKNYDDVEKLKEQIINSDEFYHEELKNRLNSDLSIYCNIDDLKIISFDTVNGRIDEIVNRKKIRVNEIIKDEENKLKEYVKYKNYNLLNGKILLTKISQKIGLKREILARNIAHKMSGAKYMPTEIKGIIEKL